MNGRKTEQFRLLLSKAVREIAFQDNKPIHIVQDELGHALGRDSGSCIDYWKRGHIPASLADVETLVRVLVQRGGLTANNAQRMLLSAEPFYPPERITHLLQLTLPGQYTTRSSLHAHDPAQLLSPFVVGPPITQPRQFFGRERELQRIFGWWQLFPLQNVAIVGRKRSGKTSLLHYLRRITQTPSNELRPDQRNDWLPQPERFRWILVDFQDPRMTRLERLLGFLLSSLGIEAPAPCTLDSFMDSVNGRIHRPTIILMDELVAALEAPELDISFWWALRALVSHGSHGNLAFVLSAHDLPMVMAETQGKPSPFFNLFSTLELGPLTETAARALIASSPQPFPAEDADWIVEQSRCWPALVQILSQARLDALQGRLDNAGWQEEGLRQIDRFAYLLQD